MLLLTLPYFINYYLTDMLYALFSMALGSYLNVIPESQMLP